MTPFYELVCFYADCGTIRLAKIPELKLNLFAEILVFHKKGQLMADLLNSCQDVVHNGYCHFGYYLPMSYHSPQADNFQVAADE